MKTFLIQLAWADRLSAEELNDLLSRYENEISMQLLMQQEKIRRGQNAPNRNPREVFLWDMISENLTSSLKNELDWVRKVRQELRKQLNAYRNCYRKLLLICCRMSAMY